MRNGEREYSWKGQCQWTRNTSSLETTSDLLGKSVATPLEGFSIMLRYLEISPENKSIFFAYICYIPKNWTLGSKILSYRPYSIVISDPYVNNWRWARKMTTYCMLETDDCNVRESDDEYWSAPLDLT